MKKIILIAIILITFSGIIAAQTVNPNRQIIGKDTLMNGQKFGNPKLPTYTVNGSHQKNGNTNLGPSFSDSLCGLNYVQGSVLIETRYNASTTTGTIGSGLPANISISGLSPCNIIKAY